MEITILIGLFALCAFIAWKLLTGTRNTEESTVLRELLENLRRELSDTKDKLHDRLGKNAEHIQERLEKTLDLVGKQLGGMDNRIDKRVGEINNRLDAAAKLMGLVQKQYGTVESLSQDIKHLQEAFKAPKPRGSFSEKALVDMAQQMLPVQRVHAQYAFRSGVIVDLMIETAHGKLCIDAKFPLENYLRLIEEPDSEELRRAFRTDVRKHIRDIRKKYILPDEGTLDTAFMYVPSDAVMYEILEDYELTDLAAAEHITMLSPHTFHAFLTVLYSAYQSQQFAENAKQVLTLIRGIRQQNGKLGEELNVLQRHLTNATNKMGDVTTEHSRLDLQIGQADSLEAPASRKELPEREPAMV